VAVVVDIIPAKQDYLVVRVAEVVVSRLAAVQEILPQSVPVKVAMGDPVEVVVVEQEVRPATVPRVTEE
jgi:hypothetical protein